MTKKIIALLLLIGLVACGGGESAPIADSVAVEEAAVETVAEESADTVVAVSNSATEDVRLNEDHDDALPVQSQLAIGTLQLDSGDLAVDEATAAKILPLWRALQALGESENTAQAELTAVVNQIQKSMTPEQVQAIADLQLTQDSFRALIDSGEIELGGRGGAGAGGEGRQGGQGGVGGLGGGQRGQGGDAGGLGGGAAGGQGGDAAAGGRGGQDGQAGFLNRGMTRAVVNLLAVKVGEEIQARDGGGNPFQLVGETVATALDMSTEALAAEIEAGKTYADVIGEQGGDIEAITADLITALQDTNFAQRGNLEETVPNILNGINVGRGGQGDGGQGGQDQEQQEQTTEDSG